MFDLIAIAVSIASLGISFYSLLLKPLKGDKGERGDKGEKGDKGEVIFDARPPFRRQKIDRSRVLTMDERREEIKDRESDPEILTSVFDIRKKLSDTSGLIPPNPDAQTDIARFRKIR
jgi:hypothetical protein